MTNSFYKDVYSRDFDPENDPYAWIQWKGTDVCMDIHCECGEHGHVDGDFVYFYKCPVCNRKYALGQNVKLIPLTEEQIDYVEKTSCGFVTDYNKEEEIESEKLIDEWVKNV